MGGEGEGGGESERERERVGERGREREREKSRERERERERERGEREREPAKTCVPICLGTNHLLAWKVRGDSLKRRWEELKEIRNSRAAPVDG